MSRDGDTEWVARGKREKRAGVFLERRRDGMKNCAEKKQCSIVVDTIHRTLSK